MNKTIKITIAFIILISLLFVLLIIAEQHLSKSEITLGLDKDSSIEYVDFKKNRYYIISQEGTECNIISNDTFSRSFDLVINEDNRFYDGIVDENLTMISSGGFSFTRYGYKQLNEEQNLLFSVDGYSVLSLYCEKGFVLPNLNSNEIKKIRIEYLDNFAAISEGYKQIISDKTEIERILSNPNNYFQENSVTDMYITYEKYDIEEWFNADKIEKYAVCTICKQME